MKKRIIVLLITIISYSSSGQTNFENGYFINSDGATINCLIKSIDWKKNPSGFKYKLSKNDKTKTANLIDVAEFGINNFSKYIRATVNLDRSPSNLDLLTEQRDPVFNEETLFLKVLIEGEANLYLYEDTDLRRFFFNVKTSDIQQLVFKKLS